MRTVVVAIVVLLFVGLGAAAGPSDTVATVGTRTITQADLEQKMKPKLIELQNERYEAMRDELGDMVSEELIKQEAKARNTTPEALVKSEVEDKVAAPEDAQVQALFDANKAQLGGQTLEQIKPRIVDYLKQQGVEQRRAAFVEELKKKYPTSVKLRAPVIPMETAGRPERGGAKAPVTIVMFSDYECPFCVRAEAVVDQVMKTYGDKVRLVFRDYPLPMHPNARPAAEAAACANDQGKYWSYHEKLFANNTALGADKLKEYAKDTGLDMAKFDKCVADKTHAAAIDKDVADGAAVGVNGTPAFFINGRMLSGAQPFERFKEEIDADLASAKP